MASPTPNPIDVGVTGALTGIPSTVGTHTTEIGLGVLAVAVLSIVACGASSASPPSAASTPAVDTCLVGRWTTTALSGNTVQDGERLTFGGGAGETFTISADGGLTIETSNAEPIIMSAPTRTFTLTAAGTGVGKLTTPTRNEFTFIPGARDTLTTTFTASDGSTQAARDPDSAFTAIYTCVAGESFTFKNTANDSMVDAATFRLTASKPSG